MPLLQHDLSFFLNAEMSGKYNRYSTITYKNSTNDMTEYGLQTKLLYAYKQLKGNIYMLQSWCK